MKTPNIKKFLREEVKARNAGKPFIFADRIVTDDGSTVFVQCLSYGFFNKVFRFEDFVEDFACRHKYQNEESIHEYYRIIINRMAKEPMLPLNHRCGQRRQSSIIKELGLATGKGNGDGDRQEYNHGENNDQRSNCENGSRAKALSTSNC